MGLVAHSLNDLLRFGLDDDAREIFGIDLKDVKDKELSREQKGRKIRLKKD